MEIPMLSDPFGRKEYDFIRKSAPLANIFLARKDGLHLRIIIAQTDTEHGTVAMVALYDEGEWHFGQANNGSAHPVLGKTLRLEDGEARSELGLYASSRIVPAYHAHLVVRPDMVRLRLRRLPGGKWKEMRFRPDEAALWEGQLLTAHASDG